MAISFYTWGMGDGANVLDSAGLEAYGDRSAGFQPSGIIYSDIVNTLFKQNALAGYITLNALSDYGFEWSMDAADPDADAANYLAALKAMAKEQCTALPIIPDIAGYIVLTRSSLSGTNIAYFPRHSDTGTFLAFVEIRDASDGHLSSGYALFHNGLISAASGSGGCMFMGMLGTSLTIFFASAYRNDNSVSVYEQDPSTGLMRRNQTEDNVPMYIYVYKMVTR